MEVPYLGQSFPLAGADNPSSNRRPSGEETFISAGQKKKTLAWSGGRKRFKRQLEKGKKNDWFSGCKS